MTNPISVQILREILQAAGVTDLSENEISRIATGATAAINAVEQTEHYQTFDNSKAEYYATLEKLAPQRDSCD